MYYLISLYTVLISLFYMVPGFILGKFKLAKGEHLKTLSSILLYFLAPMMILSSFLSIDLTKENIINMLVFFATVIVFQLILILALYLIFKKKMDDSKTRLTIVSSVLGNVGFFGMPLVTSIFPDQPIVIVYSSMFMISLNILSFTVASFCITNDKKYISIKNALINPATIALLIAIPLFIFKVKIEDLGIFGNAITLLGKMTTPVCMLILGIRLSYATFKELFNKKFVYICCIIKQIIFPLCCFFIVYFISWLDASFKGSILVLCACPSAAVVHSLCELYHNEEENSANVVLLSTLSSIITIPPLLLLLNLL